MPERRGSCACDFEAGTAQRIRARYLHVRRHPIVWVRLALLGGQQREKRREGIDREGLARRDGEVFTGKFEVVSDLVVAHHGSVAHYDLDAKVVERELVVYRQQQIPFRGARLNVGFRRPGHDPTG